MLELPESYNIAKQLNENIAGNKIISVLVNQSPHKLAWLTGETEDYKKMLLQKTITEGNNHGGMVEITAEDAKIVFTDGVNIKYFKKGENEPSKHQLKIDFDDFSFLACNVQMYGGLYVFVNDEFNNEYYLAAKNKVSPLSEFFDYKYFLELIDDKSKKLSAKAFLATDQRIPGLGNGVLQDILFNARINPKTKIGDLEDVEIKNLYKSVKTTLLDMAKKGGRDTEKDIFSKEGGYKTIMSKNTYKQSCPACGGEITKKAYMGGSVYFCPSCQKEK